MFNCPPVYNPLSHTYIYNITYNNLPELMTTQFCFGLLTDLFSLTLSKVGGCAMNISSITKPARFQL